MQAFLEKNNGKLVGTQADLKTIPLDRSLKRTEAEILIITLNYPNNADYELIEKIQKTHPKIQIITILKKEEDVAKLIKKAVSGFLLINEDFDELIKAIKVVMLGKNYYSPKVAKIMARKNKTKHGNLTHREIEILYLLKETKNRDEITEKLKIRRSTLRAHIRNIKTKLPNAAI